MPPDETCIGILAKAVSNLEQRQLPVYFDSEDVFYQVLQKLAPHSQDFLSKFILGNMWLFKVMLEPLEGKCFDCVVPEFPGDVSSLWFTYPQNLKLSS